VILRQTNFIVVVCAGLFWCSQAIAGRSIHVSSKTSVTGGTIVRYDYDKKDHLPISITIKELDTNKLIRFGFIKRLNAFVYVEGSGDAGDTEVIVDDQTATPDKLKVGMRAQVVFYTGKEGLGFEGDKFIKSVKAISRAKQKPTK
jgi:hypothetical protein